MEPAVSPRSHRGADRTNCLLFFLVLLCLPCSVNSLSNKDNTEYERKYDVIMSKLMQAAASLVNKDQLKALKNKLQPTGNEADRRQVEKLNRIEAAVKDFDDKMNHFQRQANREKAESEALQKIMKKAEDLIEKAKGVIDKMDVSGAKAKVPQKMLQGFSMLFKTLKLF